MMQPSSSVIMSTTHLTSYLSQQQRSTDMIPAIVVGAFIAAYVGLFIYFIVDSDV